MSLPRLLTRWFIPAAAVLYLVLMFFSGAAPTHRNRVENEDNGVMAHAPAAITRVSVSRAGAERRFERSAAQWHASDRAQALAAQEQTRLEQAIRFMHTAPPVRILLPEETAGVAAAVYGFDPPSLTVRLETDGGKVLTAMFGARSNDEILRYLKLEGRGETYLMSGFVGDAWEAIAAPVR